MRGARTGRRDAVRRSTLARVRRRRRRRRAARLPRSRWYPGPGCADGGGGGGADGGAAPTARRRWQQSHFPAVWWRHRGFPANRSVRRRTSFDQCAWACRSGGVQGGCDLDTVGLHGTSGRCGGGAVVGRHRPGSRAPRPRDAPGHSRLGVEGVRTGRWSPLGAWRTPKGGNSVRPGDTGRPARTLLPTLPGPGRFPGRKLVSEPVGGPDCRYNRHPARVIPSRDRRNSAQRRTKRVTSVPWRPISVPSSVNPAARSMAADAAWSTLA